MPQPAALDEIEEPLVKALRGAWDRVMAEQNSLIGNPASATKRKRLLEIAQSIYQFMDEVDDGVEFWVANAYPQAYALGVTQGGGLGQMLWTNIHQEAVEELAQSLFQDLLEATKGVRASTKSLVRSIARDEALQATIAGGTAQQAGRAMRDKLAAEGIHAVTYVDGSRHTLTEYSEMSMRTSTAKAYNQGSLNANGDVKFFEIFDGPKCGLASHDDVAALGMIVDKATAEKYLISHPNCRRSFGPRPDVTSKAQAKELAKNPDTVGSGQTTLGQREAQVEQDRGRAKVQQRKAARQQRMAKKGGLDPDRLEVRDASLPSPMQTLPSPLEASDVVTDSTGALKVKKIYTAAADVPSVADLVMSGFDPEDALVEWKRLTKNAKNVERRARNKAKAGGKLGDQPAGPVDLIAKDQALPHESNPAVLHSQHGGPGGAGKPWYDRIKHDTVEPIPVQNLEIEGYKVRRGVAVRHNGRSYLQEMADAETEAQAVEKLKKTIQITEGALANVPKEFHKYQRGVAALRGHNPADATWAIKYNTPGFKSAATGGRGGTTYWNTEPKVSTALHEFGHNVDTGVYEGGHGYWSDVKDLWANPIQLDEVSGTYHANNGFQSSIYGGHSVTPGGKGVTGYGATNNREDFAESVRLYFQDRHNGYLGYTKVDGVQKSVRFADVFPERAKALDGFFDLPPTPNSEFYFATLSSGTDKAKVMWKEHLSIQGSKAPDYKDLMLHTGAKKEFAEAFLSTTKDAAVKELAEEAAAKAAKEAAEKAAAELEKVAQQLKNGKLTTEGLDFSGKTSVGLKKNNAYKKAIAQGKSVDEATKISLEVEQQTIAEKLGLDYDKLKQLSQGKGEPPEIIVTVKDLTTSDKVGIGVKKSNAYKAALKEADLPGKMNSEDLMEFVELATGMGSSIADPKVIEAYAKLKASQVEAAEIEIRLARIKAERGAGKNVVGIRGARGRMRPQFNGGARLKADRWLDEAGSTKHPKAKKQYDAAAQAKDNLVTELADRLNNREDWDRFAQASGIKDQFDNLTEDGRRGLIYNKVNQYIGQWASTSGDSDALALAMQKAIAQEFGLDVNPYVTASGHAVNWAEERFRKEGDFMRRFVRVQYEHTQEELAKAGITEVAVYRGMRFDNGRPAWAKSGINRPELQPANSWSTRDSVSKSFGSTFFTATIPADQILGSARTGFGCRHEFEFVILDSPGETTVKVNYRLGDVI